MWAWPAPGRAGELPLRAGGRVCKLYLVKTLSRAVLVQR